MKQIKLVLSVVFFVAVLAYTLAFAAHNSESVNVNFLAGIQISMPLALWAGIFVSAGALIVWLITGLGSTAQKLKLRQLQKELEEAKRRLDKVS